LYALVGVWRLSAEPARWGLTDETHTLVETYEDGWAWSVPISASTRHVGTMVDGTSPRVVAGRALRDAYEAEIRKTARLAPLLEAATLEHVFACDASLYSAQSYGGPRFLLVGDAGSFIDPLSSFGVKKALASAWVGAVVVHTCLVHPDRQAAALEFFSGWEREVYATHLRRSRDFARAAHARHPHPFWALRAETEVGPPALDEAERLHHPDVRSALEALKERPAIDLVLDRHLQLVEHPVIRGREIVLEDALPIRAAGQGLRPARARHARHQVSRQRRPLGSSSDDRRTQASARTLRGVLPDVPAGFPAGGARRAGVSGCRRNSQAAGVDSPDAATDWLVRRPGMGVYGMARRRAAARGAAAARPTKASRPERASCAPSAAHATAWTLRCGCRAFPIAARP
jgi:hypothetical protein